MPRYTLGTNEKFILLVIPSRTKSMEVFGQGMEVFGQGSSSKVNYAINIFKYMIFSLLKTCN